MNLQVKAKLLTLTVVFLGIIALALGYKAGVDKETLLVGGSAFGIITGMLRSMVMTEQPATPLPAPPAAPPAPAPSVVVIPMTQMNEPSLPSGTLPVMQPVDPNDKTG